MALLFLGKLLIAIGICYQAFVLYDSLAASTAFNAKLTVLLSTLSFIPADIKLHIVAHLRLVVVGFLGCSAIMVISRSCFWKTLVLLGLVIVMLVNYYPIKKVPSFTDTKFWESLAIIGGIIYLMGAECSPSKKGKYA